MDDSNQMTSSSFDVPNKNDDKTTASSASAEAFIQSQNFSISAANVTTSTDNSEMTVDDVAETSRRVFDTVDLNCTLNSITSTKYGSSTGDESNKIMSSLSSAEDVILSLAPNGNDANSVLCSLNQMDDKYFTDIHVKNLVNNQEGNIEQLDDDETIDNALDTNPIDQKTSHNVSYNVSVGQEIGNNALNSMPMSQATSNNVSNNTQFSQETSNNALNNKPIFLETSNDMLNTIPAEAKCHTASDPEEKQRRPSRLWCKTEGSINRTSSLPRIERLVMLM